jgi:hypothetical protein
MKTPEEVKKTVQEILEKYLSKHEIQQYESGSFGIMSITVYEKKPECKPGCCC